MGKEPLTRITIENYDNIFSWETPFNDVGLEEIFSAFIGLLVGCTWNQEQILEFMKEYAEERLPIEEDTENEEGDEC